jgi:ferric-dicitrate binding protein FerR (iron transport regulator)
MLKKSIMSVLLAPACLFAGEAGKITFLSGQVEVDSGKGWQKANLGAMLNESDKIRTGSRGTVLINLKSGAALKMKSDSLVVLSQVGNATTVDVETGALFSKVGKRSNGQSFRIRAQTMVAAVRGTEFYFAYGKVKKGKADLWLCVNEGQVNVTDSATKSDVNVNAGEGIIIPTDKQIPKPKAYAWTKKLNWNMDASQGPVEDNTDLKGAYKDLLRNNYD